MLTSRPVRVVIGAAVFALGILAGAGIAAWFVQPASGAPALSRPDADVASQTASLLKPDVPASLNVTSR
jgi:hypothetical protein